MIRLQLILIALVAGCSALFARGAERPQHNFLFIIDSSSSMIRHKPAAIELVRKVIGSRFEQQIESGDSIDIWTYDTENNLRGFPPQIWRPAQGQRIADTASEYLETYPFKGKSDFSNVATDLNLLVPQTKALLIVVITDGESPFSGIPLDLDINGYLAKNGKLGPAQDPFLISLSAIKGTLRTWTAHFGKGAPDLATLPERPSLSVAKSTNSPKSTVVQAKQPPRSPSGARPQTIVPKAHGPSLASELTEAPSTDFIFNFPPGTKITPIEPPLESTNPFEKPLAVAVAERLNKLGSSNVTTRTVTTAQLATEKTNGIAAPDASRNSPVAIVKTNFAHSSVPTNTGSAKAAAASVATNKATVIAASNGTTTVAGAPNVLTKTTALIVNSTNKTSTNAIAAVLPTNGPVSPAAGRVEKRIQAATAATNLNPHQTLGRAIYLSAVTGFGCVLLGGYLVYRKFRRPSQSIISRSLLQR